MDTLSFANYFTGGVSSQFIFAALIFLILAFITIKVGQFMRRDVKGERTPEKASFKFWWNDNYMSVVLFALAAYPLIVFSKEFVLMIGEIPFLKSENPMWIYYVLGGVFGYAGELILKRFNVVRNVGK